MPSFLSEPDYMPCPECGASIARTEQEEHVCERERWLRYQMFQLRAKIEDFESDLRTFLASPVGRFELWYAERERRRRRGNPTTP
jgi:hypothetical protein